MNCTCCYDLGLILDAAGKPHFCRNCKLAESWDDPDAHYAAMKARLGVNSPVTRSQCRQIADRSRLGMAETAKQIEELAVWTMAHEGMPSLVINAPEDDDDCWRVFPSGHAAVGIGATLARAVDAAHQNMALHKQAADG